MLGVGTSTGSHGVNAAWECNHLIKQLIEYDNHIKDITSTVLEVKLRMGKIMINWLVEEAVKDIWKKK